MKRLFSLLLLCLLLAGCGHSPVGKYVNDKNPANTVELESDGTFTYFNDGIGLTGKYTVDGNEINTSIGPVVEKGILDGSKLTMGNNTFTKQ